MSTIADRQLSISDPYRNRPISQMWNLRLALENNMSPADMTKLEPLIVKKKYGSFEDIVGYRNLN